MEPSELNSPSESDARLDSWLREANPALPDQGFSARVLATLPPPVRPGTFSRRWILCTMAALVGAVVAWPRTSSWNELTGQVVSWSDGFITASSALTDPKISLAVVVAGLSLIAVFWRDRLSGDGP